MVRISGYGNLHGANFRLWKSPSAGVPFKGSRLRASQKVGPRLVQDRPKPQPKVVQGRPQSKIGPSLSPGPILVDQSSGPVQKHQIWPEIVENRRFGVKLGPEACQDRSGAFRTGLTHSKGPSPAWSWRSKSGPQCRFGPKSSKMVRIGSRIDRLARNKDQMNPTACADPSGPLLRPKTA